MFNPIDIIFIILYISNLITLIYHCCDDKFK